MSPAASATRAASRWFERVVAVAIGSLATAWWLRGGGEADPGAIAAADPVATASQPEVAAGASPREPPRADMPTTAPRVAAP
ncbi:MAG: hypothetical protein K1X88_22645, partial [Nannocystaceae bacterium]|nr:hypothetical protein [Nannocystaceae bacterium]